MLGAIIGGALALGGSLLSSKSNKKAADKAADTSLQVAQQNNALASSIYSQNQQALNPYVQRGNVAGNALQDFYGLGGNYGTQQYGAPQPMMQPQAMGFDPQAYGAYNPGGFGNALTMSENPMAPGSYLGENGQGFNGGTPMQPYQVAPPQQNAGDPFRQYIANSDYGFQFGEGANQVNSGYAGRNVLQSGAAMKDLERFRQNLQSGYRNDWASGVANQQGTGLSAAGAQAGVGVNYVGQVSQNNNNAGTAAANAALAKGANSPWNALSLIGGTILGRSM